MLLRIVLTALTVPLLAQSAAAEEAFVPSRYQEAVAAAHVAGTDDHVITVRKITSAVENLNTGKITVFGVTQVLDCRTGNLVSQSRCDPCEYNVAQWPKRPTEQWFAEESWPVGSAVGRAKAQLRMEHFERYFKLGPLDGVDDRGMHHQFWSFDGRRPAGVVEAVAEVAPPPAPVEAPKPRYGPVECIDIFVNGNRPEEFTTQPGEDRVTLKAVAWASQVGGMGTSQVEDFKPMWSTSCGSVSNASAKEIAFTLSPGLETCKVFLFEARTGREDAILVRRGRKVPAVRLAITFEGGREADGVALTGSARSLELAVQAFDPAGTQLNITPEWSVEGGKVEFLEEQGRRRLRVHVDPGTERAVVRARDPASGAEDTFLIEVRD